MGGANAEPTNPERTITPLWWVPHSLHPPLYNWQILDTDSESPYVHVIHEDAPISYAYRACWVDTRRNKGPYGDPAVCTVSV